MVFHFKKPDFKFFSSDLAVDLGTSNVLIYVEGQGVLIREPSVVAVDKKPAEFCRLVPTPAICWAEPPAMWLQCIR